MGCFDWEGRRWLMDVRKENLSRAIFLLSTLFSKAAIDLNLRLWLFKVFKCEKWDFIQSLATVFFYCRRWPWWFFNINFENFRHSLHRRLSFLTLLSLEVRKWCAMKVIFWFLYNVERIVKIKWLNVDLIRIKICYIQFRRPYV